MRSEGIESAKALETALPGKPVIFRETDLNLTSSLYKREVPVLASSTSGKQ
jgi:hypothetical protein